MNEPNNLLRLIFSIWMLTSLILSQAYISSFYSILTFPKMDQFIDTIEDLLVAANSNSKNFLMLEHTSYFDSYKYSLPENYLYYAIGKHLNR